MLEERMKKIKSSFPLSDSLAMAQNRYREAVLS